MQLLVPLQSIMSLTGFPLFVRLAMAIPRAFAQQFATLKLDTGGRVHGLTGRNMNRLPEPFSGSGRNGV
jgi:hypothetical protein